MTNPTRQEMLDSITHKIARTGGGTGPGETGYFLPVMIGDILKYVDDNLFWNRTDYGDSRNMDKLKECVMGIFYHFVGHQHEPINTQPDECITYIFNLISND